jgi:hypothetical protein
VSKLDQVVKAFSAGRSRTVGGLMGIDPEDLDELVEDAEREVEKRLKRAEWTQADLDRLACAFTVLAYKSELERRT